LNIFQGFIVVYTVQLAAAAYGGGPIWQIAAQTFYVIVGAGLLSFLLALLLPFKD
jgi:hypothetical protein